MLRQPATGVENFHLEAFSGVPVLFRVAHEMASRSSVACWVS
jgi:hypothetical protein